MTPAPVPPKSLRIGVLATVVALHVVMLIAILWNVVAPTPPAVKAGILSLVPISADLPAQRLPAPPELPSKIVDEIRRLTEQAPAFEPDSTALSGEPGQCATLQIVSNAIVADASVVAAIVQAPPEARSIAEAIVMWNAAWSFAASTPASPLAPARAVVEHSLKTVEDICLDEQIVGPRLIPVPIPNTLRTSFLVFGSGSWSWRDLLAEPTLAREQASGAVEVSPGHHMRTL